MGQMATGGDRISLPLAVGVDRGHPQAAGSGSRPLGYPSSSFFFFFFFFWVRWFAGETNRATKGGRISPPSRWGGSRPPPVAGSFFFFFFAGKVAGEGNGPRRLFAGGGRWAAVSGEVWVGWLVD
jgi:hypothetical protein